MHPTELLFLGKKDKCFRVYYYINDTAEQMLFDIFDDFVLEILYRGEKYYPVNEIKYWEYCGFSTHLIRDQYETQYRDLRVESRATRDIYIDFATELEDALFACVIRFLTLTLVTIFHESRYVNCWMKGKSS